MLWPSSRSSSRRSRIRSASVEQSRLRGVGPARGSPRDQAQAALQRGPLLRPSLGSITGRPRAGADDRALQPPGLGEPPQLPATSGKLGGDDRTPHDPRGLRSAPPPRSTSSLASSWTPAAGFSGSGQQSSESSSQWGSGSLGQQLAGDMRSPILGPWPRSWRWRVSLAVHSALRRSLRCGRQGKDRGDAANERCDRARCEPSPQHPRPRAASVRAATKKAER
ncbi:MAG: hypothetical protein ACI8QS_002722 [Planctomycetota bacterium]